MVKFINAKFDLKKKVTFSYARMIFLLAASFSIGVLFGIELFLVKNQDFLISQPQVSSLPKPAMTPSPSPTVTPIADNINSWQSYRNEDYGFEFKYPPELNAPAVSGRYENTFLNTNGTVNFYFTTVAPDYSDEHLPVRTEIINGINMKIYGTNQTDQDAYIPLPKISDYLLEISKKNAGNVADNKNFEKILSTFKFIDLSENSSIVEGATKIGYIKSIYERNNKRYLDIDYVKWLSHSTGGCSVNFNNPPADIPLCGMDGYLIVNNSSKIITLEISTNAKIFIQNYGRTENGLDIISYQALKSSESNFSETLFNIEFKNNVVTKITQQYQP